VIQWMFNNSWPSIYWHLFDWYLLPAGGYFGAKKANEPVHVLFSYDDRSIAVVNSSANRAPLRGVHLRTMVFNVDGTQRLGRDTVIDIPADSVMRVTTLPEQAGVPGAYLVDLRLIDAGGHPLSTNFYWLSGRMDTLSDSSTWYVTGVKEFADFTALRSMPQVPVNATARFTSSAGTGRARVTLKNPGRSVAFFMRLQVTGRGGEEALPVIWDDNYVSLLPGETRVLTAEYRLRGLEGGSPKVVVSGWNVPRKVVR
jgi:exo-1,4-beta-D-glucosaminidase